MVRVNLSTFKKCKKEKWKIPVNIFFGIAHIGSKVSVDNTDISTKTLALAILIDQLSVEGSDVVKSYCSCQTETAEVSKVRLNVMQLLTCSMMMLEYSKNNICKMTKPLNLN